MANNNKLLAFILIALVAASALSYLLASSRYSAELRRLNDEITKLERLSSVIKEPVAAEQPAKIITSQEIDCTICHDYAMTKNFHLPQMIMKIDEARGKRRRVCIDCHGPLYPGGNAEVQATPLEMINYNPSIGLNGIFEIKTRVPHDIHKKKIENRIISCTTCHGEGESMIKPSADVTRGQVLYCQNCKYHPEEGNYLTIHLELARKQCTICHIGKVVEIHKEKTAKLGRIE
jgi:hypothetical protein